jgi:GT2 family glycosyltransferase
VTPHVSVVIPVYRDWRRLGACLAALEAQTIPRECFEILVVDNDEAPLPVAERPAGARYVAPRPDALTGA